GRAAQLADLPLVWLKTYEQCAEPKQPDAHETCTEPHRNPAPLVSRECAAGDFVDVRAALSTLHLHGLAGISSSSSGSGGGQGVSDFVTGTVRRGPAPCGASVIRSPL